jgi:hypothetical protein
MIRLRYAVVINPMEHKIFKIKQEKGAAMIIALLFFVVSSVFVTNGLTGPTAREYRIANESLTSKQGYFLSESGAEDAFYRMKSSMALPSSTTLTLNGSSATTTITDLGGGNKQITSASTVAESNRAVDLRVTTGTGVSFNYGMQIGSGGLDMDNSSQIIGNVYVNGNITGANSAAITGTAVAANQVSQTINQSNGSGTPSNSITFANTSGAEDSAQSFVPSATDSITQIAVYIKKSGSPSDLTVRISPDASGAPDVTSIATGTILASTITTSYGWNTVVLSSTGSLTSGTTYWLVLDGATSSSNYYIWGASTSAYSGGLAKTGVYGGTSWNNTSPSGLDAYFKVYLGYIDSTISGMDIGTGGTGDAWAHTVTGSNIAGNLYCQTGSSNNKSCNTSRPDPDAVNFPVSEAQIADWQADALSGGTYSGNYTLSGTTATLGPKKITGDLTLSGTSILSVSGTLWVTGDLSLANSSRIQLSSTYGSQSGVIIVDGTVSTANTADFAGSGTAGSYLMILTTSASSTAIDIANSAGTVILYAPNGTIKFSNSATVKEAVGKTVIMSNTATLTYDSGLANLNFSSGPSGSYSVSSWKESQ